MSRVAARLALISALLTLSACTGVLGSDFNKYAGGPDSDRNAAAARDALVTRLPIGSDIDSYIQLFKSSGGACINHSTTTEGVYGCKYSHGIAILTTAEWIAEIRFDKLTKKSKAVSVEYFVTSL